MPCCADRDDLDTTAEHRITLSDCVTGTETPLCRHCDPLAKVLEDVTTFELRNYERLPLRIGWPKEKQPTLVHDVPLQKSSEATGNT